MKITLEYVAMLHVAGPASGGCVDLPTGSTVADLLHKLQITAAHQKSVSVFVNDTRVRHVHQLVDGDRVFLSIPISGG